MIIINFLITIPLIFAFFLQAEPLQPNRKIYSCINNKIANEIEELFGFECIGMTTGGVDSLKVLGLEFNVKSELLIDEARKLLIRVSQYYQRRINEHAEISEYSDYFPLNFNSLQIVLYFQNPQNNDIFEPFVTISSLKNNKIDYYYDNVESKPNFSKIIQETYAEALEKVNKQK